MPELYSIIERFSKCKVQSEMEVRSGLILPLLEYLHYPLENKAEEFPVYGSEGSTKLKTKKVDYLLFSNGDFSNHTMRTDEDIDWVQKHSLLVVEAKNTNEMPASLEQPYYYTIWTKALAYIITDGIDIIARMGNPFGEDVEVINCKVSELGVKEDIRLFSFEALSERKRKFAFFNNPTGLVIRKIDDPMDYEMVRSSDDLSLSNEIIENMRDSFHIPNSKTKAEVVRDFLSNTNAILRMKIRHDIPDYFRTIPRGRSKGFLYVDDGMAPLIEGYVTYYYANDVEIIVFETSFIKVTMTLYEGGDNSTYIELEKFSNSTQERKQEYEKCLKVYDGSGLCIKYFDDNEEKNVISRLFASNKRKNPSPKDINKKVACQMIEYICLLEEIEEQYNIQFDLSSFNDFDPVSVREAVTNAICIWLSMKKSQNLILLVPETKEFRGEKIEGGTMKGEEMGILKPEPIVLFGYTFIPKEITIYPVKLSRRNKRNGFYTIPVGCVFDLLKA